MTKKKRFHSLSGKGKQAKAYEFFHRPNAWASAQAAAIRKRTAAITAEERKEKPNG